MAPEGRKTIQLPRQLLDELNISRPRLRGQCQRNSPPSRKEQRKAERTKKKKDGNFRVTKRSANNTAVQNWPAKLADTVNRDEARHNRAAPEQKPLESILKTPKDKNSKSNTQPGRSELSPTSKDKLQISRGMRDKLAADDAEIAALEKALGMKGNSKLPKAFEDDGLDVLLDDKESDEETGSSSKRKRAEYNDFLAGKRRKLRKRDIDDDDEVDSDDVESIPGQEKALETPFSSNEASVVDDGEDDQTSDTSLEGLTATPQPPSVAKRERENPYIAPKVSDQPGTAMKYVPPSLRKASQDSAEDLNRLKRQTQGLLNRLSEDNLLSILSDIEKLYSSNPRQHVSQVLLDLLVGLFCDATGLQDTFVILHAGLITAIHKVVAADFGPQVLQKLDEEFTKYHSSLQSSDFSSKQALNLINLLSTLYTFQVISSTLLYDYIRLLLTSFSESNAELLLKVLRNAGPQIRQDDPSSLKDVITLLSSAVAEKGEQNLSARTKFMIETMHSLRNNKMKTGHAASAITSAHTIRMKKILGSLNQSRTIKASEPLNISLQDLRNTDKRGRWWLIGASYRDNSISQISHQSQLDGQGHVLSPHPAPPPPLNHNRSSRATTPTYSPVPDLHTLALHNRMTTPIRRAIFIALMSAEDCTDAYIRLQKLNLRNRQREEIPKVLVHCAGAEIVSAGSEEEGSYNPYYTLVARRLCQGDKKAKVGMRFAVWDFWGRISSDIDNEDTEEEERWQRQQQQQHSAMNLRSIVNIAKMYGNLVAEGILGLEILKTLDLMALRSEKVKVWLEVFFITVISESSKDPSNSTVMAEESGKRAYVKNEEKLLRVFLNDKALRGESNVGRGVRWFLGKVVRKTDIAGGKEERDIVRWGCKVLGDALQGLSTSSSVMVDTGA